MANNDSSKLGFAETVSFRVGYPNGLSLYHSLRVVHSRAPCQSRLRRRRRHRLFHLQLDVQVAELFRLDGAGRVGHQTRAFRGFWERDDRQEVQRNGLADSVTLGSFFERHGRGVAFFSLSGS